MSTSSFPLATVAAQVTPAGISAPSFADILASFQASVQSIFGTDVVIDPDSKDGQLLAILAQAQYDSNQCAIAVYNSYNPQTATGVALDGAVKVNGIRRAIPSASTVLLHLEGQAGVQIHNGIVQDLLNNLWNLPALVTFPPAGFLDGVVATCQQPGAIAAPAHSVTIPFTQVVGWQVVTNPADAVPGAPVESDGQLRQRQTVSTSLTAVTTADALLARVLAVPGVRRAAISINDTAATDPDTGVPSHSFSMIVDENGVDAEVAQAIEIAKDVGAGTFGNTTVTVEDPDGFPIDISFDKLVPVAITVALTIQKLPNFNVFTADKIKAALVSFANGLAIGADVWVVWMMAVASLNSNPTYVVADYSQSRDGNPLATADIPIAFNEAATLALANITITALPEIPDNMAFTSKDDYLALITSEHQGQPNYAAFLSIFLAGQVDLMNLYATFPALFDVDTAVGAQLDAVGVRVGQSRDIPLPLTGVYFSWDINGLGWDQGVWQGPLDPDTGITRLSDEPYRQVIKATIAANSWDGTAPGAHEVYAIAFGPGMIRLVDNQDMTIDVIWTGPPPDAVTMALLEQGNFLLQPAGVAVTTEVVLKDGTTKVLHRG